MTIEKIKQVWGAEPFRPFFIQLADGRALRVPHREFLSMSPSGRTIIVHQLDDSFNIIDLLLVTDLEIAIVNGRRNGQAGRRKGPK